MFRAGLRGARKAVAGRHRFRETARVCTGRARGAGAGAGAQVALWQPCGRIRPASCPRRAPW
eukprot:10269001-Lingulodinium_polyedra.AAC.1